MDRVVMQHRGEAFRPVGNASQQQGRLEAPTYSIAVIHLK